MARSLVVRQKEEPVEGNGLYHLALWLIFAVLVAAVSGAIYIGLTNVDQRLGIGVGVSFAVIILAVTIIRAWQQVPNQDNWIIELLGNYHATWKPGLHFIFPWFGLMRIRSEVFMGEQQMLLFLDERMKEGYGKGHVDFVDGSAPVSAAVFFRFWSAYKATYEIEDVLAGIEEVMDAQIRSCLGGFTIDQANKWKSQLDLYRVLNGIGLDSSTGKLAEIQRGDYKSSPIYQQLRGDWSVEITRVSVTDIELPESVVKEREKVLAAEKEAEAAKKQGEATVTRAEAQRQALEKEGQGLAEQIRLLKGQGMTQQEAVRYLQERLKWGAVGASGNTLILDGGSGGSPATFGAQFAAGMGTQQRRDRGHGGQRSDRGQQGPRPRRDGGGN